MPARQLAAIVPALSQIFVASDEQNWCATFEAEGRPDCWVQVMLGSVNAAYPYDEDPLARLERCGLAGRVEELIAFEAKMYATFILKEATPASSAAFVDDWFATILELGDGYATRVQLEDLG